MQGITEMFCQDFVFILTSEQMLKIDNEYTQACSTPHDMINKGWVKSIGSYFPDFLVCTQLHDIF